MNALVTVIVFTRFRILFPACVIYLTLLSIIARVFLIVLSYILVIIQRMIKLLLTTINIPNVLI